MNCPCCSNEMQKGVVQSAREVFFRTEPRSAWSLLGKKGEVSLSEYNFTCPTCTAYICRACRKVVVDYAEKSEYPD